MMERVGTVEPQIATVVTAHAVITPKTTITNTTRTITTTSTPQNVLRCNMWLLKLRKQNWLQPQFLKKSFVFAKAQI